MTHAERLATEAPGNESMDLCALLMLTRHELQRADHKAEVLFTGSGVMTGAVAAGTLVGEWSPLVPQGAAGAVWWAGVTAWALALVCLAAAVYPRTRPATRDAGQVRVLAYYADVARLKTSADLHALLAEGVAPNRMSLVDQVFRVSKIVRAKYRCVLAALWLLGLGGVCVVTSVGMASL